MLGSILPMEIAPELVDLAVLLGTWHGEGHGVWPTTEPFRYGEEITFEHVGEPYLLYSQRSWLPADGAPSHHERGFFLPGEPGRVEAVLAHPIGVVEVTEGPMAEGVIDLRSVTVARSASGLPVTELRRRITVAGDALSYVLQMATAEVPLTLHLEGELRRA